MSEVLAPVLMQIFNTSAACLLMKANPPYFTVVLASDKYLLMTGRSREEMIGAEPFRVFPDNPGHDDGAVATRDAIIRAIETKKKSEVPEYLYYISYGDTGTLEPFWWSSTFDPIMNEMGVVEYVLGTATDLTEQVKTKKLLEQKSKELGLSDENLQLSLKQLMESEAKFKLLADNIPQLAWMADKDGYVFWYNQPWYDYTGATFDEMKGYGWQSILHPDQNKSVREKFREVTASLTIWEDLFQLRDSNGQYRWFLTRAVPVQDLDDQIIYWFGTSTDINDQKETERQKDEFISIASHELRTPVTSLRLSLQLLDKYKSSIPDNNVIKLIEQSNRSLASMLKLLEGLLDVQRIKAGRLTLKTSVITVESLLEDCCDSLFASDQQVLVREGNLDISIKVDPQKIGQVIINLLSNAEKYAPKSDKVILKVSTEDNMAKISVTDNGPGIPKGKQQNLFNRYYRADVITHQPGLGLGLYISAEIIKQHGGNIGVISETGHGCTFWFTVPLA